MSTDVLIRVRDLCFGYNKTQPLISGLNLNIHATNCYGVFGTNGSGKTSFFYTLLGILKPYQGSVLIYGKAAKKSRHLIGYMPQLQPKFNPYYELLTCFEILKATSLTKNSWGIPILTKATKDKIYQLLERFNASIYASRPFGSLSGGQKQRIRLIQAILNDPQILLLDEPIVGLDPQTINQLVKYMSEFKQQGKSLIVISHDINSLLPLVDYALFFSHQQFVQGKIDKILDARILTRLFQHPIKIFYDDNRPYIVNNPIENIL